MRECLLKALVFGVITIAICCHSGFTTHRRTGVSGSRAVSLSTTRGRRFGQYCHLGGRLFDHFFSGMIGASLPPILEVTGLRKHFGEHVVLASVSLVVPRGSIVSVLGRSGTGKSVFLKCLAGLLQPDAGEVRFQDGLVNGFRLRCSYLFQGNALFDSLTALENVALPLEQTTRLGRSRDRTGRSRGLKKPRLGKICRSFSRANVRRNAKTPRTRSRPGHASRTGAFRRTDSRS